MVEGLWADALGLSSTHTPSCKTVKRWQAHRSVLQDGRFRSGGSETVRSRPRELGGFPLQRESSGVQRANAGKPCERGVAVIMAINMGPCHRDIWNGDCAPCVLMVVATQISFRSASKRAGGRKLGGPAPLDLRCENTSEASAVIPFLRAARLDGLGNGFMRERSRMCGQRWRSRCGWVVVAVMVLSFQDWGFAAGQRGVRFKALQVASRIAPNGDIRGSRDGRGCGLPAFQ